MKHARLLLLALCMTAGAASMNASAEVDAKVQRCHAKLHSCFQSDFKTVFSAAPASSLECLNKCDLADGNPNACSYQECLDRCQVAFGFLPPPCE